MESTAGKATFKLELTYQQAHDNYYARNVTYGTIGPHEVARLQARLLLFGEPMPLQGWQTLPNPSFTLPNGRYSEQIKQAILPELWKQLNEPMNLFIPKAWLHLKYHLIMCAIVDQVDELKLKQGKAKQLIINFKGTRRQYAGSKEHDSIVVDGECLLV